jgi:hypothetical protein
MKPVYVSAGLLKWKDGKIVRKTKKEYKDDPSPCLPIEPKGNKC